MSKAKVGIKAVSNPTAQTGRGCMPENTPKSAQIGLFVEMVLNALPFSPLKVIIELLYYSGLRISEVLSISDGNITSTGQLLVRGAKGSNDRLVTAPSLAGLSRDSIVSIISTFVYINRYYVYREMKKMGFSIAFTNSARHAVTHSGRYLFIKSLQALTNNIDSTALLVGHKSSKNTALYANKKIE